MDLSTNIIQNVYNIGTNSCSAGTQYCTDGYALYFPCLKDITKGQDVCFDFYIADSSTKDVMDLRDVDAISLNLIGPFNCHYGTFSYPDNISSLQTENYPIVYSDDFEQNELNCHLTLFKVHLDDEPNSEIYYSSKEDDFYLGTEVEISAYDTPTHIFVGWTTLNLNDGVCGGEELTDNIISKSNVYHFIIEDDVIIFALYRKRRTFRIVSDPTNVSSFFDVYYDNLIRPYHISNKSDEVYDDTENDESGHKVDYVDVLEGYNIVVECIPNGTQSDSSESEELSEPYKFVKWKDGEKSRYREFKVGYDTKSFEDGLTINLKAVCIGPVPPYELDYKEVSFYNEFDEEGIHINSNYYDKHTVSSNGVKQDNGYLHFNDGTILLSSAGIEDGIKVNLYARSNEDCEIYVTINDYSANMTITPQDEYKEFSFYFTKCNSSDIEIRTEGECFIERIEVCEEVIVNKGKAQLCLDAETTSNLPSGNLSINGAITVNGVSYGLATTQIGTVNKLPKITLNIEQ